MDFLDISSLGLAYRYVVKIEHKFKQKNKWEFRSANPQQPEYGKGIPKSYKIQDNQSKSQRKKGIGKTKRTLGSGVTSKKTLCTTPMNVARNNHWWSSSKKQIRAPTQTLI
jgi:hypothetical protein